MKPRFANTRQVTPTSQVANTSSADPDSAGLEYARQILIETREELVRADGKASILLAATGIAVGALLAGLLAGTWSPLHLSAAIAWVWWIGVLAAAVGVFCLGSAIQPRIRRRLEVAPSFVAYYLDAIAFADSKALADELRRSANVPLERLADQIRQVSLIVVRKYMLIRWSLWLLGAGAACCTGSVIIDRLIH